MFITVGDSRIYATSFGTPQAPAILGIGGWIGSWELWAEPFSALSASWFTISFDHRGSGATNAPVESIIFDRMVEDVFVVLDTFGVESCVLAAESAGAAVALGAALKRPDRISGLAIVDGLVHRDTPEAEDRFLAGLRTNYRQTLDWFVQACIPETDKEYIKRWGRQILDRATPEAAIALHRVASSVDLRPDLQRIKQPMLILHGDKDPLVSVGYAKQWSDQVPNAKLVILEGAGHVPTLTFPLEIAREINSFFRAAA